MKCLFLLPKYSNPRFRKRIRALMAEGIEAKALYFKRPSYKGNSLPCPNKSINFRKHGKYFRRLSFVFNGTLLSVLREARNYNIIYAFGFDVALLAIFIKLFNSCKLVYEIADIRDIQLSKGVLGYIVRTVEKFIIRQADELIVTAPGFATEYYDKILGINPNSFRVIENRLDLPTTKRPMPKFYNKAYPIVIGYFGNLRSNQSWKTLKSLARQGGDDIKIIIRGYPRIASLPEETSYFSNIVYGGPYISPDELPIMYSSIDIVWGCIAPENAIIGNWKWARTNRFYEACFFRRPIISHSCSDEGHIIESLNIGMTIDLSNPDKAAFFLLNVLPTRIFHWQKNVSDLPDSFCTYTNEHNILMNDLKSL